MIHIAESYDSQTLRKGSSEHSTSHSHRVETHILLNNNNEHWPYGGHSHSINIGHIYRYIKYMHTGLLPSVSNNSRIIMACVLQ